MKKNILTLAAIFVTLLLIMPALTTAFDKNEISQEDITNLIQIYNTNIGKVPPIFIKLFGNEKINLYIDNELFYGFRTENGRIKEEMKNGISNPTLNVYVTQETIDKIIKKEITAQEALKKGYIDYKGVGLIKKTKFGFVKNISKFFLMNLGK